ncbi:hypothetical protein MRX96_047031 [Rhipicephalus microplus]
MVDTLCYQSNLYSTQKNGTCANITKEKMRKYLPILVISGTVRVPHFLMFWQCGTRFEPVADLMSRNRFEAIHQCLHMNDNCQAKPRDAECHHRHFKVRPLVKQLKKNMKAVAPEERQSADEQIILFKGRSPLKQYMKSKPHKSGYKVFTRAGVCGIMHDFIIYEGKGTAHDNGFGISGDIVINLVKDLPELRNHKLFCDNWFSSLHLVDELKRKGFLSVGTVRVDRTEKRPLAPDATLKAQGRGSVNFRVDKDSNIGVMKWFDSNSVHLVSSYAGVQPTDLCKQWNSKEKLSIDVPRPFAVKEYNAFMGGVDLANMLIELYRTDHKSKRWYMRIFYWMMDVSIVNGWLLYKRHCAQLSIKRRLSLLAFRLQIAQTLAHLKSNFLKRRSGMPAEAGIVPAKHLIHSPVTPRPTVDVRYDGMKHWPQYGEKKEPIQVLQVRLHVSVLC